MKKSRIIPAFIMFAVVIIMQIVVMLPAFAVHVSLSNRYIEAKLGRSGVTEVPDDQGEKQIAGRWAAVAVEGDPETSGDNNMPLIFFGDVTPAHAYGYFKIRIGQNLYVIGDPGSGYWSSPTTGYEQNTSAGAKVINPPIGSPLAKYGRYLFGEWTTTGDNPVKVKIRMSLVRDQIRFEFDIENPATNNTPLNIGFQMHGDTGAGDQNPEGWPFIPGIGVVRGGPTVPYGMVLSGTSIPSHVDIVDNIENPVVVTRNTLSEQDATPPDHFVYGRYIYLNYQTNVWIPDNFIPDPLETVNDMSFAINWAQRSLSPGSVRRIVTYFGLGAATSKWTVEGSSSVQRDSICLAVQSVPSLKYDSSQNHTLDITPNPFKITAYVANLADQNTPNTLGDVSVSLFLPRGLRLVSGDLRQNLGMISSNNEGGPAVWYVEPTGEYSGELEYRVMARDDVTGWQQSVTRKVLVPSIRRSLFTFGWQFMHVPFNFNNFNIYHAMSQPQGRIFAYNWDPVARVYKPMTNLSPGRSFWLFMTDLSAGMTEPLTLSDDAVIVGERLTRQEVPQEVELSTGWNMIGNPFVYPIYWGQVLVKDKRTNNIMTVQEAIANNWISGTLFSWNTASNNYDTYRDAQTMLHPWKGYWLRAKQPVILILRPAMYPNSSVNTKPGGR
ncbi:MAG: hypothetical protein SNJ70_06750 [Armatimonadota bacterium]